MSNMRTEQYKALRHDLGLNQKEFWGKIGVTQCTGSRYELGRLVPMPVRMLILLAYGNPSEKQEVLRRLGLDARD